MIRLACLFFSVTLLLVQPLCAQRPSSPPQLPPRANQGHIPSAPGRSETPRPMGERLPNGKLNESQHVNHDQWFGHDTAGDRRFHLEHPFDHGRFPHPGPDFRFNILRVDRNRHWFWVRGGFYFEVAAWDWPLFLDWCLDCGDDFVIYEDFDHPGWYMLYNIYTGAYVHVRFLGV